MKRLLIIASASFCALLLVAAIIALNSRSPRAGFQRGTRITNQTMSLQVASTTIDDKYLIIDLKNVGTKAIIAYDMLYGDMTSGRLMMSGLFQDVWKPGDVTQLKLALKEGSELTNSDVLRLDLAYCIFEDLSSEGDWEMAARTKEMIEGQWLAFQLGQKHYSALMQRDRVGSVELQNVMTELKQIPVPEGLTQRQKNGFNDGLELLEVGMRTAKSNLDGAKETDKERMGLAQADLLKKTFSRGLRISKSVEARIQAQRGGASK